MGFHQHPLWIQKDFICLLSLKVIQQEKQLCEICIHSLQYTVMSTSQICKPERALFSVVTYSHCDVLKHVTLKNNSKHRYAIHSYSLNQCNYEYTIFKHHFVCGGEVLLNLNFQEIPSLTFFIEEYRDYVAICVYLPGYNTGRTQTIYL